MRVNSRTYTKSLLWTLFNKRGEQMVEASIVLPVNTGNNVINQAMHLLSRMLNYSN